jgi:hypothetical protein
MTHIRIKPRRDKTMLRVDSQVEREHGSERLETCEADMGA